MNLLTIAIPTFNRADRLDKSLGVLLEQIIKSGNQKLLSVFVSNNGSTDITAEIIDKHSSIFKKNNIHFLTHAFSENRGFDANVLNCYTKSGSGYIWFLSDDDNIIEGAINSIISDIRKHAPSVLYYNFDQNPYHLNNPYIREGRLYDCVDINNVQAISKIIAWPKLTSLVIKKTDGQAGEMVKTNEYGFMHIALAIQTGLGSGRVFHSDTFIARVDDDYLDHIDFPPYIGNGLKKTICQVLSQNNKADILQQIDIRDTDPLTSSMDTLGSYYRGKSVLSPNIKSELYSTVRFELSELKIPKGRLKALTVSAVKLLVSFAYNLGHMVLTGKSATRPRAVNAKNRFY